MTLTPLIFEGLPFQCNDDIEWVDWQNHSRQKVEGLQSRNLWSGEMAAKRKQFIREMPLFPPCLPV